MMRFSDLGAASGPTAAGFDPAAVRRRTAERFTALVADEEWALPLPGGGDTRGRFARLAEVAEQDLSVARLFEGHVDAVAILAELGFPAPAAGERWGVWAAEPPGPGLTATATPGGWRLDGRKRYCSGASSVTHALVTACAPDGRRLFRVAVGGGGCVPVPDTWQAIGMAGSDTPDVTFEAVAAEAVGGVEAYLRRPGFEHGGIGVAACWYGGARGVANALLDSARRREPGPHSAAHLGFVDIQLHAARTVLERAADEIDADPLDREGGARLRGLRARGLVEEVCTGTLTRVGRALGAEPLCHDLEHATRVGDLTVYIRQHHAERDLAELGELLARTPAGAGERS
jgi:alkylation response protein AidB-like acyl-CoA dehydrogenase